MTIQSLCFLEANSWAVLCSASSLTLKVIISSRSVGLTLEQSIEIPIGQQKDSVKESAFNNYLKFLVDPPKFFVAFNHSSLLFTYLTYWSKNNLCSVTADGSALTTLPDWIH